MNLSQMQDIGGCRAVVNSIESVNELVNSYGNSSLKHKLDHVDDYIENPRNSGYRGVHLIYRYHSSNKPAYNGLRIEIQMRSILQHAWATAVETFGTFTGQALKASQGRKQWLQFFKLMGNVIAIREGTNPVPDTPTTKTELKKRVRFHLEALDVEGNLQAFGATLRTLESGSMKGAHYFLLKLDANERLISITGYQFRARRKAESDYLKVEREIADKSGFDAVLVHVGPLKNLRRAYPNYFLDTQVFMEAVRDVVA